MLCLINISNSWSSHNYHIGIYRIVPLSFTGHHLVGFPAAGALFNVPTAAAAPFVKLTLVLCNVPVPVVISPDNPKEVPVSAPNTGVTNVGLVLNTATPVPVSSLKAAASP